LKSGTISYYFQRRKRTDRAHPQPSAHLRQVLRITHAQDDNQALYDIFGPDYLAKIDKIKLPNTRIMAEL
jgi:hypothetical protein